MWFVGLLLVKIKYSLLHKDEGIQMSAVRSVISVVQYKYMAVGYQQVLF